ncbi:FAD-dependent monooxygenase [Exiguobacterium sp. K1]|uniref:FAD-dependent monooxygenase n=1 Tax=Exiguobacterium sp. K1 TaxID=2980105 RepID=UPI00299EB343|nr:FAD-dependent monooxygenase [Exiguobacterium sp. K1]MDX1258705.1 FAD-dependent monooxygenase [Exiguobacterium sp. K1]
MKKKIDVLIIGAGPTGLTLALALSRYGLTFRIIERASGPSVVSKAIGIQARSLELFARLGVADALMENAIKINQGNLYVNGAWQAKLDFTDLNTPFPFVTLLPQSETERILETRLKEDGHTVERETELTGFAQFPTFVTASIRKHDVTETVDASFIIGADGANSFVRRELGLPFSGKSFKESWALADIEVDWPLSSEEVHIFFSDHGVIESFPLQSNLFRITGNLTNGNVPTDHSAIEDFLKNRAKVPFTLKKVHWYSMFRVHNRIIEKFGHHRIYLIGDAAHINSPVGGQGMNTGIADAMNLAWKLWCVHRFKASFPLLDSYSVERREAARGILRSTNLATELLQINVPFLLPLQEKVIRNSLKITPLHHYVTNRIAQLNSNYQSSRLFVTQGNFPLLTPRPGEPMPYSEVVNPRTKKNELLLRRADRNFLLLLFLPREAGEQTLLPFKELAYSYPDLFETVSIHQELKDDGVVDQGGELARKFGIKQAGLYLIRPDGYIAYRQQGLKIQSFSRYLERLLYAR